jgi:hypothetical protein
MTNSPAAVGATRLWLVALTLLALFWLEGEMRRMTLETAFGLHAVLALACGIGAVLLTRLRPGPARWVGAVLVLLVALLIGVVWEYLYLRPRLGWPDAIGGAASFLIVPGAIAAFYGNRGLRAGWTFVQVASLVIAAAPVSTTVSFFLAVMITGG